MAQTKAKQGSMEDDEIKETKANKENTSKLFGCNICGNSFIYEESLFDHDSNNHNNRIINNIQFNDLN